jgi:asparagine synthase (glutamine-hydrolysing)
MCGIAGFVAAGESDSAKRAVAAMVFAMRRRGPDGQGIHSWPDATLGHRRLAILDLSNAGAQPMLSADGQIGLVFNGCIYNFLDLRAELVSIGHRFHSECDTEVLLEGYRAWGIGELTRRLRGMFAFAIWDESVKSLFLVRDRLGVKPLIYSAEGKRIAFASTIDALRAARLTGEVDPESVVQFLEYGFVTDRSAIFSGVRKLPPATILTWRDGNITEHRYWTLPEPEATGPSFDEAVERTEALLLEAVKMRLISDVPLGALLSGGVDSTLICWAMAKLKANITAFTVAVPGDAEDEMPAAAITAKTLGIDHRVVALPESSPALIDEVVEAYSEPFAVHSALGMLLVAQAVRPSAKVLLTGDGGDDVFLGYPFMRNAWLAQRFAQKLPAFAPGVWNAVRGAVPAGRARSFLDYSTTGIAGHARAHDGLPWFENRGLLGGRLAGSRVEARHAPASFASARRLLSDVLEYHRQLHFTSEFMPKVDAGALHFGIEARSPFLDQALWEFAASLPFALRLRGGELKAVLRETVRRRVGMETAARRKQGFSIPVERWLAGKWSSALATLEGPTLLERDGWIAPGRLHPALEAARRDGAIPVQLWRLLILERWLASRVPD